VLSLSLSFLAGLYTAASLYCHGRLLSPSLCLN
jgi:hypothetical protein